MTPVKKAAVVSVVTTSLLAAIAIFEGSKEEVYVDIVGVPTVCNGHTGPDVKLGDKWSKEKCDATLVKDVRTSGERLLSCVTVPVSQSQYEAFASLTYNIGAGAFCKSTLVKLLNSGDYAGACRQILRWDRAGGVKVAGLARRRQLEYQRCVSL